MPEAPEICFIVSLQLCFVSHRMVSLCEEWVASRVQVKTAWNEIRIEEDDIVR